MLKRVSGALNRMPGGLEPITTGALVLPYDTYYHFDGDNIATMYSVKDDPDFTDRIAGTEGEDVHSWGLRTSSHKYLERATADAADPPSLTLNAQNSRSVIQFNAGSETNQFNKGPVGGLDWSTKSQSVYVVFKWRSNANFQGCVSYSSATDDYGDGWYISEKATTDGGVSARRVTDHDLLVTADIGNDFVLVEYHLDEANSLAELIVNGGALSDSAAYSPALLLPAGGSSLMTVGSRYYTSARQNLAEMDLAELAMYQYVHNASQRQFMRSYLNDKWNLY